MTTARVRSRGKKRSARRIDKFFGFHYGVGRTDQPDVFAYVSDLKFVNDKAEVRDGKKKAEATGRTATVRGLFPIRLGGVQRFGVVSGGSLDVADIADIL